MPSSLKFVLALIAAGIGLAIASGMVLHYQSQQLLRTNAEQLTGGDSEAGRLLMTRYGCSSCHEISGVPDARGTVGPSLTGIAERSLIAGKLPNTPANMIRWIREPQSISPGSGMPNLGASEKDARDMAAYVYTLDRGVPDK
jgi:cytochrome c2